MKAIAALAFALLGIHVGGHRVLHVGYAPAWSPDGARLAYVTRGDLWVADADGSHGALLVRRASDPDWAPDGRRLAFTREDAVWVVRADGLSERRLVRGAHPAWSPDGLRIAYDDDLELKVKRADGMGAPRVIAAGHDPAYASDGRLVWGDGQLVVAGIPVTGEVGDALAPSVSPDGRRIAFVDGGRIFTVGLDGTGLRELGRGAQPAWRPEPRVREVLPDFDQRPPSNLQIAGGPGLWRLGFTSLVDNLGPGPAIVEGVRHPGSPRMDATQHVLLSNGRLRSYAAAGRLRYTNSPPHHHWHLMRFDAFELRTPDGRLLVRDRKTGFCLADHWGHAPGTFPDRHPRFLGDCAQYDPSATHVVQGTSPGYTDRYPAFFHGQNLDVTGVPAGIYVLGHRANANLLLHELRYDNDAASVRIRLTWAGGRPSVVVLRNCPATASC